MTNMSVFQILFIVIFICSFSTADAFGVKLECPILFHNGENTVICRINKTAIREANCFSIYKSVTFDWTLNGRTTVACLSPEYNPNAQCTPQYDPGSCRCHESNGEILTYNFSFLANRTLDEGGQLECKLCILPDNPLPIEISKGCKNISFADDSKSDTHSSDQSNTAAVIGAVVGTLTSVAIVVIIIIIVFRRKKYHCQLPSWKKNASKSQSAMNGTAFSTSGKDQVSITGLKLPRNKSKELDDKEENRLTGHETAAPEVTQNTETATIEDKHSNKQLEENKPFLNGNAKNFC